LEVLQACQGKKIILEMVNEKLIAGTILSVNHQFVRLKTKEEISNIPLQALCSLWETQKRFVTEKNMGITEQSGDRPRCLPAYKIKPAHRHQCLPRLTANSRAFRSPYLAVASLPVSSRLSSPR